MSPTTTAPPPSTDEELTISAPMALSEFRALEKSRLIYPTPPPRQPILAPLEADEPPLRRRGAAFLTAWVLIGAGLAARTTGLVDTTSVDTVAIADLEPVESWIDDNIGFADGLGIPRRLAATDSTDDPQINSQVVSVAVDDEEFGLARDGATDSATDSSTDNTVAEPADGTDSITSSQADDGSADQSTEANAEEGTSDAKGDFALAWSKWLGSEHLVTGEVVRQRLEGDTQPITIAFQSARKGDTAVQQLGSSAVVESDRGRQTCERAGDGTMLCTPPVETTDGQSDELQAIATLLAGPSPTYSISELPGCPQDVCTELDLETTPRLADAACWQATAAAGSEGQRWGETSVFCFDPTAKAMVARQTLSANRVETFVASEIRSHVDNHELQPK